MGDNSSSANARRRSAFTRRGILGTVLPGRVSFRARLVADDAYPDDFEGPRYQRIKKRMPTKYLMPICGTRGSANHRPSQATPELGLAQAQATS